MRDQICIARSEEVVECAEFKAGLAVHGAPESKSKQPYKK